MRAIFAGCLAAFFAFGHAAFSADMGKMQDQMLGVSAQINESCSGTLFHSERDDAGKVSTYILTAKHCIDGRNRTLNVDLPVYQDMRVVKKERYLANVKAQDYGADLAILILKDRETQFETTATIAPDELEMSMGEPVWTVGYPLGRNLTITDGLFGLIQTIDWPKDGTEYFRATPDATYGSSGGALYRKTAEGNYELIGVVTGRMRDNTFMTLYTPLPAIRDFLERADREAFGGKKPGGPNSR